MNSNIRKVSQKSDSITWHLITASSNELHLAAGVWALPHFHFHHRLVVGSRAVPISIYIARLSFRISFQTAPPRMDSSSPRLITCECSGLAVATPAHLHVKITRTDVTGRDMAWRNQLPCFYGLWKYFYAAHNNVNFCAKMYLYCINFYIELIHFRQLILKLTQINYYSFCCIFYNNFFCIFLLQISTTV